MSLDAPPILPCILVIMGVSGSGKTTIAHALTARLHWPFQEGDDLHPPFNRAKMQSGTPLTDADRLPWLQSIARWIDERQAAGEPGIITCSALKRSYREIIVGDRENVQLVFLTAEKGVLRGRMGRREGHFMPASLLDSQLETLEEPGADEGAVVVRVDAGSVEQTVEAVLRELREKRSGCWVTPSG